jgi:hypothetical protein
MEVLELHILSLPPSVAFSVCSMHAFSRDAFSYSVAFADCFSAVRSPLLIIFIFHSRICLSSLLAFLCVPLLLSLALLFALWYIHLLLSVAFRLCFLSCPLFLSPSISAFCRSLFRLDLWSLSVLVTFPVFRFYLVLCLPPWTRATSHLSKNLPLLEHMPSRFYWEHSGG